MFAGAQIVVLTSVFGGLPFGLVALGVFFLIWVLSRGRGAAAGNTNNGGRSTGGGYSQVGV